jgi:AcrR family transcriptional regulator
VVTRVQATKPGRPRRLTVTQVVEAAIRLVESAGVSALTMEAVARELDVGTMTLYGYVDSRDDLIDRAVAHLLTGAPEVPKARTGDWIETVVSHCLAARRWLVARPALLLLNAERPHLSDSIATRYASELEGFVRAGFSLEDAAVLRHAIAVQLFGQIQWEEVRRVADRRGVLRGNRARARKMTAAVGAAADHMAATDPEELYERSLRALLAGFEHSRRRGRR